MLAGESPDIVDVEGTDHAAMVKTAIDGLGGINKFVRKGDYVVLKPNAGFANPEAWGTTTHPQTVLAVAKMCLEAGAKKITLVEFPLGKGMKCLERCGIAAVVENMPEVSIKILGVESDFKQVKVKGGVALQSTDIAKQVLSADVLINIPAAKHHSATGVSLGLKNAMGLIYDRQTFHTHIDLQQGIADLGRVIKPTLTIVDATRALLTNGPAGPGESSTPNRMIAGFNVVSVDAYTLGVARFGNRQLQVSDVPHIRLAGEAGLGETDVKKLRIKQVKV
ncbi:MAG: hypothetical protein A2289_00510 [Deltaproteobacteria bacterium RIFOXYA12_FULL_58_15]|nr:MAG: hypothetical protein A2289_00510 [Deltaproteobacteria bacterium RIFOXYA12_FULL_58_15]